MGEPIPNRSVRRHTAFAKLTTAPPICSTNLRSPRLFLSAFNPISGRKHASFKPSKYRSENRYSEGSLSKDRY